MYDIIYNMVSSGDYDFLFKMIVWAFGFVLLIRIFCNVIRYSSSEVGDISDADSDCQNSNDKSIEDKRGSKVKVKKTYDNLYSKYYSHYKDDSSN